MRAAAGLVYFHHKGVLDAEGRSWQRKSARYES
jgi:hypothetical protein